MRFFSYRDPAQHAREQIRRVKAHPWIAKDIPVRGVVFDMETGLLREIESGGELAAIRLRKYLVRFELEFKDLKRR